MIHIQVLLYSLPGNEKKNPTNNSRGRSHTLTVWCSDLDNDSVETNWSKREVGNRRRNMEVDIIILTNSPAIMMCVVILLFMLVWLLKARQEYGPLWSSLTLNSSNNGPVVFTSSPLKAHWSWAGGLDCTEQSMVRLDPTEKEVVFCPFAVRAMLSGPSEKERERKTDRRGEAKSMLELWMIIHGAIIAKHD